MRHHIYLAFSNFDRQRANSIWKALTIPGVTRWLSTREPLDDVKSDPQDLEELHRATTLILVCTGRAIQEQRLALELAQARRRGMPMLVILVGPDAKCSPAWNESISQATVIRVPALHAEEVAQVIEHIKSLIDAMNAMADQSNKAATTSASTAPVKTPPATHQGSRVSSRVTQKPRSSHNPVAPKEIDPLERAMDHGNGDAEYASRRLSMDQPVSSPKRRWRLWPPRGRTALVAGVLLAGLATATSFYLRTSLANQSGFSPIMPVGLSHVPRQPALPVNGATAKGAPAPDPNAPLPIADDGQTKPANDSKSHSVAHVITDPDTLLTPDQRESFDQPTDRGSSATTPTANPPAPSGAAPDPSTNKGQGAATQPGADSNTSGADNDQRTPPTRNPA